MMTLTVPKSQTKARKIYYVTSEQDPTDVHIVVGVNGGYFCDCRDYMIRRLGTGEVCKHIDFVKDTLAALDGTGREIVKAVKGK